MLVYFNSLMVRIPLRCKGNAFFCIMQIFLAFYHETHLQNAGYYPAQLTKPCNIQRLDSRKTAAALL